MELGEVQHLLGDDAGRHDAQRETAAEGTAAAEVVVAAVFDVGGEVGVTGTRMLPEAFIILAVGILIAEEDGERGAGGVTVVHARDNLREVVLYAGGGAQGAGLAAGQVLGEVFFAHRDAGQYAVDCNADARSVGLAKNAYSESIAKCVHSFSNNSMN